MTHADTAERALKTVGAPAKLMAGAYDRLTVVGRATVPMRVTSDSYRNRAWWIFDCECGTRVVLYGGNVRSGSTRSCGCLLRESALRAQAAKLRAVRT